MQAQTAVGLTAGPADVSRPSSQQSCALSIRKRCFGLVFFILKSGSNPLGELVRFSKVHPLFGEFKTLHHFKDRFDYLLLQHHLHPHPPTTQLLSVQPPLPTDEKPCDQQQKERVLH